MSAALFSRHPLFAPVVYDTTHIVGFDTVVNLCHTPP